MTLSDLIAALEQAPGPSRELDAEIDNLLQGGSESDIAYVLTDVERIASPKPYTESVDAALTLVPEGMSWRIGCTIVIPDHESPYFARVNGPRFYDGWTPAIAICIAALRARPTP